MGFEPTLTCFADRRLYPDLTTLPIITAGQNADKAFITTAGAVFGFEP